MLQFLRETKSIYFLFIGLYLVSQVFIPLSWVIGALVGLVWVIRKNDRLLILGLVAVLIMGDNRMWHLGFFKNLRIVMILLAFLHCLILIGKGEIKFRPLFLLCIPFFVIAFFGGLRSPEPGLSLAKMFSYLLLIFAVIHYIPYLLRRKDQDLILDIIKLSLLVFTLGFIIRGLYPQMAYIGDRYRGILGNPNGLGTYATMVFPLYFIYLDLHPEKRRFIFLVMGFCILSTILCGSRTALGTMGIFYMLNFFHKSGRFMVASLYLILIPIGGVFLSGGGIEYLISLLGLEEYLRVESLNTGTGRYLAWSLGLSQIAQNPVIGRGFAWEEIYFYSIKDMLVLTEHQGGMHNSYLTFIMNNGYLGFLLFVVFLIYLMSRMKPAKFAFPFAVASILSSFFESWLNSSLNAFSIHFYLVLMVLVEYPNIKDKNSLKK